MANLNHAQIVSPNIEFTVRYNGNIKKALEEVITVIEENDVNAILKLSDGYIFEPEVGSDIDVMIQEYYSYKRFDGVEE